ncbi:MAG: hypothetical protein M1536_00175 [Firmicutes bacterium]|nr:hypothetical protein [Bacillota bacterium]
MRKLGAILEGLYVLLVLIYLFYFLQIDILKDIIDPTMMAYFLSPIIAGFWITFRGGRKCLPFSVIISPVPILIHIFLLISKISFSEFLAAPKKDIWHHIIIIIMNLIGSYCMGEAGASVFEWLEKKKGISISWNESKLPGPFQNLPVSKTTKKIEVLAKLCAIIGLPIISYWAWLLLPASESYLAEIIILMTVCFLLFYQLKASKVKTFINVVVIILFYVGIFLEIIGFLGFFRNIVYSGGYNRQSSEAPLKGLDGIAVDDNGRIYCAVQAYGRVQVYDKNGNFIRSCYIDSNEGFRINVDDKNNLYVNATKSGKYHMYLYYILYVFNKNGELIKQKESDEYTYFKFGNVKKLIDKESNTYEIRSASFYPHIVKIFSDGKEVTIVATNFFSWLLMGPPPALYFWGMGMILFGITTKRFEKTL